MPSTEYSLTARNLSCERGNRRLFEGVGFVVESGIALRVAAPNGRGKTTLLKALAGLKRPDEGVVEWLGQDALASGFHGQRLYLAHENALNPDLSPTENLAAWMALYAVAGDPAQALERVGLRQHRHRACRSLSAGQQRRAALARLCVSGAPLWLLDEPAAALDSEGRKLVAELITAHLANGGMVIFTTHEPLPYLDHRTLDLAA